ncbi:MAG: hypothetical protein VYA17_06125 [Pseudomonadota bacterium]|nr:hypothetical protein [Pseudomonadota bacterium]
MTRIPTLGRNEMDTEQKAVHDRVAKNNARVGFGPAIGYAYSAEVWRLHNETSTHLLNCSLTGAQVRIVSLMTVRHWNSPYPWSSQAKTALNAGLKAEIIDAINSGKTPEFDDDAESAVYAATKELLASGSLSRKGFKIVEKTLGYKCLVELVATVGHFCTTAMMANVVGAVPAPDASSRLKR